MDDEGNSAFKVPPAPVQPLLMEEPATDGDHGEEKADDDELEDDDVEDDNDDVQDVRVEGAYDAADYESLPVSEEVLQLFQFISSYTPQTIDLEHKLKPFVPDYIPAIGDIDAFIKVGRPDGKTDNTGLSVLDEPRSRQSDGNVLDLQLRAVARTTTQKQAAVANVHDAQTNGKLLDKWIKDIGDLHRSKPAPSVHYSRPMPQIDFLMQEWPTKFEECLATVQLPAADLDCDLSDYVEIICSVLGIPVYKSRVQALHVMFTLYSAFKESSYFGLQMTDTEVHYQ